jgi:branched-chain amino acid transport system ATP-binding protein
MKAIAHLSDRVVVLHHGEKVVEGAPQEVLNDKKVIDAYLGKRYRAFSGSRESESVRI